MPEPQLSLSIKMDNSGLLRGLQVSSNSVEQASQVMRDALARAAESAKAAGAGLKEFADAGKETAGGVEHFTDKLKDFRSELSQENRFASLFSREIAGMGIASKSAAGEVTGLIGAFAIGGGLGVVIEVVKMLVEHFNEGRTEMAKWSTEVDKSFAEFKNRIDELKLSMEGLTAAERVLRQEEESNDQKMLKIAAEAHKKREELKEEIEQLEQVEGDGAEEARIAHSIRIGLLQSEIEKLETKFQKLLAVEDAEKGLAQPVIDQELAKRLADGLADIAKADAEEEKNEIAHQVELYKIQAAGSKGIEKLRADLSLKIAEISADEHRTMEQKLAEILAAREAEKKQEELIDQKYWAERNKADAAGYQAIIAYNIRRGEEEAKIDKKTLDEYKKNLKEKEDAAKSWGAAIGAQFADVAAGTESITKAFANMASAGIKAIVDMAIKSVEAYAASAAGAAFFSQAGIPLVGPILAVGAAATAGAFFEGLLSKVPSAEGGWAVPGPIGAAIPSILHGGEHVIPQSIAQRYEAGAPDGGGGGELHLHLHGLAHDGPSLKRVVEHPDFQSAVREAIRNGRWPT